MDIRVRVGRRIRYIRTAKELSQEIIAAHAELTRANLSRIENGIVAARIDTLHRIAQAMGIKLTDIVEGLD